ncbi:MAG: NADH-quinone oxidoreductase subunit NuoG, partial [Armatimonadetes bacterium]|nr:NADH-quinone oxidoreductase subunit NuoG [Armatimonadota bacterium]
MADERRSTTLITLTIDGKQVTVPAGTTVYHAARHAGIEVPVFCYHDRMPPIGACRVCLVQVEKMPRLQTSCTLPAQDGMVVHVSSPEAKAGQEAILEFLLANHPLDCPICDKGGECPLQDFTFQFGPGQSRFVQEKRDFPKPIPLGPVLTLDRERCILCWRCVRFGDIIAGDHALEGFDRGFASQINTAFARPAHSKFIGNTIQICPVGALTSTTYRFRSRPWDTRTVSSVCTHCACGCAMQIDVRGNEVVRTRARENPAVNDIWLCDLGWFGYDYLNDAGRLTTPLVRKNGELVPAPWEDALRVVAQKLVAVRAKDPARIGGIGGARTTNEENYLFQKVFRAILRTSNLDHRVDVHPAGAGLCARWGMASAVEDVEKADVILLAGLDLTEEFPIIWLRVKKALDSGAALVIVGPRRPEIAPYARHQILTAAGGEAAAVREILARMDGAPEPGSEANHPAAVARTVRAAKRPVIMAGRLTLEGPGGPGALAALEDLAAKLGTRVEIMRGKGNDTGAALAGVLPDRLPGFGAVADAAVRAAAEQVWG